MACLSNQIVCICAFLSNLLPALVPQPPKSFSEDEVDNYFKDYEILKRMNRQVKVKMNLIKLTCYFELFIVSSL